VQPEPGTTPHRSFAPAGDLVFRLEPEYYIGTFFLILLFIALLVVGYLPLLYSFLSYGIIHAPLQRAVMYLSATFFLFLLLARFSRKEMDKVRYRLTDQSIGYGTSFTAVEIPFSNITRFSVRSFPLIKGYVEIIGMGKRIVLPSTIHRFGEMAEALYERLMANGREDLCDPQKRDALRRIACVAAFSQARSRAAFFPLLAGTIGTAPINAFIARIVWDAAGLPQVIWMGIGLTLPLLMYGLTDYRLNRSLDRMLRREPGAIPRLSLRDELLFSSLVILGFYAAFGIVFKSLFIG
jgi:hypothetical protein